MANNPGGEAEESVHNLHIDTAAEKELGESRQKRPPQIHAPKSGPGTEDSWEAEARENLSPPRKSS